jgi:two-component system nitrate/nitrite sensor histidine kinase NarX
MATASLSKKLIRIGVALLSVAMISIGITLWVTWQLEGGAAAVNEAGRLRMQTWRLAAAIGTGQPQRQIEKLVEEFDRSVNLLKHGDSSRPLFMPWDDPSVTGRFTEVERLWRAQRQIWLSPQGPAFAANASEVESFVAAIDGLVLAIEQQLSQLTAMLNLAQFVMMALAILGAVVMLYTGYMYVINPLQTLRRGLRKVEAGDFGARIAVEIDDEFGQVAAGFNRMAETLQSLYSGLESQVKAKTQRIEAQRLRLESLYEMSAFLAKAEGIESMSRGFAERVRRVVRADAVAVRWADEARHRYLMLATDGLPASLSEQERILAAGACICGGNLPDAGVRVIPIVADSGGGLRQCAKLGFRHVVNVPVRLQHRILGEVNLFFRDEVSLNAEEAELLDALASHLASALEGLRAEALEREAAVGQERAMLARELHDSIAQSLAFLKIQVQLLRNAIARGQSERMHSILDELDAGVRESIGDVRELLVHFRTRTSGEEIEPALQETLHKFEHQSGVGARLEVEGAGLPLAPDVQIQVLHVIQEALSNVRKHAHAQHVRLRVVKGERWRFEVIDDGLGFDPGQALGPSHVGLKIMLERAQRVGAVLSIDSAPGRGTRISLLLPTNPVCASAAAADAAIDASAE